MKLSINTKRMIISIILFSILFSLAGCANTYSEPTVGSSNTQATELEIEDYFNNDVTTTINSELENFIRYDPMCPEIYAQNVLYGNWKAFAVCKTNYSDDTGDYYYDSSVCSEDDLPDLSDQVYNGVNDFYDDSNYCEQYNASIYLDQTAIVRYDGGRTFSCTYEIEQIQEDYIYCRVYEGRQAIGHFYVYKVDEENVDSEFVLKIVFYTYGGFTSMSTKVDY